MAETIAPPPPELSQFAIPIRASLAPLSPEIEKRVPRTFSDTAHERGIDIRYDVARNPIALQMIGSGLHASTTVSYAVEACRGRFPCVSCGVDEPRRTAGISLQTKLDWDPAWRLRSSTRLLPVDYARPCEVTWLNIDVTRRFVAPVVEQQLEETARVIDRNTPALTNLRAQAEAMWTALQQPSELAPRTWLVLEPTAVSFAPISGNGATIASTLMLQARTRVVIGARPAVTRRPLPPLTSSTAAPQSAVRVPFDLEIPYEEGSRLATAAYGGRTYDVNGRQLKIESIRFSPAATGRISVEAMIDYRGGALRNYHGAVFLEGTPRFDAGRSSIVVPDLEYALDGSRRGVLTRAVERAAHDAIRDRLRESARFDLQPQIAKTRQEVSRALNRQLAPGVVLRGSVNAITPAAVTPLANVISLRIIATGTAEVELLQ